MNLQSQDQRFDPLRSKKQNKKKKKKKKNFRSPDRFTALKSEVTYQTSTPKKIKQGTKTTPPLNRTSHSSTNKVKKKRKKIKK